MTLESRLEAMARSAPALLPEMNDRLARLARDAKVLGRIPGGPGPVFLTDLENMLDILEEIVPHREAGRSSPSVDAAILRMVRLADSLQDHAARALARIDSDLALRASAAVMDMGEESREPADLSHEFRAMAVTPAPAAESAGRVGETGFTPGRGEIGKVRGDFEAFARPSGHAAAPAGAVVIPAHAVLRLGRDEEIVLHVQGRAESDLPSAGDAEDIRLRAGQGGMVLHGPAVVSHLPVGDDPFPLSPADLAQVRKDLRSKLNLGIAIFCMTFFGMMAAAVSLTGMIISGMIFLLERPSGSEMSILMNFAVGLTAGMLTMFAGMALDTMVGRAILRHPRLRGLIPAKAAKEKISLFLLGLLDEKAESFIKTEGAMTFFPRALIHIPAGGALRVMEPLKALPAPGKDPAKVVDLAARKERA